MSHIICKINDTCKTWLKYNKGYTGIYQKEVGVLHREDGPAVEYADDSKEWRVDGKLHRVDGPAIYKNIEAKSFDGKKQWYLNGLRHRLDGTAIVSVNDGSKVWYIHGEYIPCKTNEEFLRLVKLKAFW